MRGGKKISKPNQKLTNFFQAQPSLSSSQPSSSRASKAASRAARTTTELTMTKTVKAPSHPDHEIISVSSGSDRSHISISSDSAVVLSSSGGKTSKASASHRRSARKPVVVKRSRSPEVLVLGVLKNRSAATTVKRRKQPKFEVDSDVEALDTVVEVRRTGTIVQPTPPQTSLPFSPRENLDLGRTRPAPTKTFHPTPFLADTGGNEPIPTSQSDERELMIPKPRTRNSVEVRATVDKWRVEAHGTPGPSMSEPDGFFDMNLVVEFETPPSDLSVQPKNIPGTSPTPHAESNQRHYSHHSATDDAIIDDETKATTGYSEQARREIRPSASSRALSSSLLQTNESEAEVIAHLNADQRTDSLDEAPSIPHCPSRPPTPEALSVETKTDKIIAQIKAAARAAALSSPEPEPIHFPDQQESSDDQDEFDLFSGRQKLAAPSVSPKTLSTSSNSLSLSSPRDVAPRPTRQHSIRSLSPLSSLTADSCSPSPFKRRRIDSYPTTTPDPLSAHANSRSKAPQKASNPLAALLREKKQVEKKTGGLNSIKHSESALNTKGATMLEMDSEREGTGDVHDQGWGDEAAARRAVQEMAHHEQESLLDSPRHGVEIGEDEVGRLVGKKKAKAIGNILDRDRKGKVEVEEPESAKAPGVPFWTDGNSRQSVARSAPCDLAMREGSGIIGTLRDALQRGDTAMVALFLNSGVIEASAASDCMGMVPWLFGQAMSDVDSVFSRTCLRVLEHILSPSVPLSFSLIKSTLLRVGARRSILDFVGWEMEGEILEAAIDCDRRRILVQRLLSLTAAASRAGGIVREEADDLLLLLHLIAMDPTTSSETHIDLVIAIDMLCNSLGPSEVILASIESSMCTKLLRFGSEISSMNKSLMISFLGGGSGRTRRIGRWVAHGLLMGWDLVSQGNYGDLPPLRQILTLFAPAAKAVVGMRPMVPPFDFQQMAASGDYEDLGHHIRILGVALSSIDMYTAEESSKPIKGEARLKETDKLATPLEMIRRCLHLLYEKILDRGGAYLDRSRTKAAIQHLELRIQYQRVAALKSLRSKKPRNLFAFFPAKAREQNSSGDS